MPVNQKPTISEDKITSVGTNEDTKEAYIESSGDSNDDTETSIETTGNNSCFLIFNKQYF